MKVAFVHDWFTVNGGAEKVAKSILEAVGEADVYCLFDFFNENDRKFVLNGKTTQTSFLQWFPFCQKLYRNYLPFFPRAIESFDLSDYDVIITSSFAVAKSVKVKEGQIHVSYCHSPMRYIWDLKEQYLKNMSSAINRKIARKVFDRLKPWDIATSERVTHFIANSKFVAQRIYASYGKDSSVLYPPVDTDFFTPGEAKDKGDYFLVVSRLVPYKKVALIAESFRSLPDKKLIVIGDGPDLKNIPDLPNVACLGFIKSDEMRTYLRNSKAIILCAVEDFGISSLEAQACGVPVLALREGGYLETVIENETGLFFDQQKTSDIGKVVQQFDEVSDQFDSTKIREHALNFREEVFKEKLKLELNQVLKQNGSENSFK